MLRKSLKRQFDSVFNKKHYYWNDTSLRRQTLKFYTELSTFQVPSEFYLQNEEAFFKLIHNTYDETKRDGACMKHMAVTSVFKEVFGQHVNKANLVTFFQAPAVKYIWQSVYLDSKEFRQWAKTFSSFAGQERNKLFNYLKPIEQACGWDILPQI
jgi:poly-beta-hydroxyalkanoate depolymerase